MADNMRIDSHKLIFHPERVSAWLRNEKVLPINMEICLTGSCNHRCTFCSVDYLDYKPVQLDYNLLMSNIESISEKNKKNGLKSVLLAGTGEPLLYPKFEKVVQNLRNYDIDVALSTNGVLFTKEIADEIEEDLSWIRFSVSGGTEETYHKIHRGRIGDLQRVLDNISYASELKKRKRLKTVLNVQCVLIPDNQNEIVDFAKKVREAGADNYIVKVIGSSFKMRNKTQENLPKSFYDDCKTIQNDLNKLISDEFQIVFRVERLNNLVEKRHYNECYASPFHAFLHADGNVYPCCGLIGIDKYCFGNIQDGLENIFFDSKGRRKEVLEILKTEELSVCTPACKLDVINQYLNELKHPGGHVNFI